MRVFWVVMCKGQEVPFSPLNKRAGDSNTFHHHMSYKSAASEAARLSSTNPDKHFRIMKCEGQYRDGGTFDVAM